MSGVQHGAGSLLAGRYRLLEHLGSGGMGTVWRGRDELLDRVVAIKEVRLPPGLDDRSEEALRRRTLREARVAARLRHTGIVTIYDVAEQDGRPWIVMELVPAPSLAQVVADRGPLPPARVASIGLQILDAMVTAQAAGVQHRDIKPANVLLTDAGRVVLTDFGIARHAGDETITSGGMVIGSPDFLAPERARGKETPGMAADLWSLGATMYAAVEGRPPFRRDGPLPTLTAIVMDEPDPQRLSGSLRPVIEGLLHKDPAHRLDADATRRLLQDALRRRPAVPSSRPQPRPSTAPPPAPPRDEPAAAVADTPAAPPGKPSPEDTAPPTQEKAADEKGATPEPASAGAAAAGAAGAGVAGAGVAASSGDAREGTARVEPVVVPLAAERSPGYAGGRGRRWARLVPLAVVFLLVAGLAVWLVPKIRDEARPPAAGPTAAPSAGATEPAGAPGGVGPTGGTSGGTSGGSTAPTGTPTPSSAPTTTPAPTATGGAGVAAPAGFRRYRDARYGFSVVVPAGWRAVRRSSTAVDFDDPGSSRFLRIDTSGEPKDDPYANWVDYEQSFRRGKSSYQSLGIRRVTDYRPDEGWTVADWEFRLGGTHVLNRNIRVSDDRAHALYWSTPQSSWDTAESRRIFDLAAASFVPAPAT